MGVVEFRKDLRLFEAVTLIIGSMIGSGILILPGDMAETLGSPALVLVAWVVAGCLTIAGALTFAELAGAFPRAGGQYVFLREGAGPQAAYVFGWTMFWVIQTGIIAAVAVAFATFLDVFVPLPGHQVDVGFLTLPKWGIAFTAVGCIVVLSLVNFVGVKYGGLVQNATTVAKVLGIGTLVALVFIKGDPSHSIFTAALDAPTGIGLLAAFGLAMTFSLFAYDGWPQATYVAAEVRDAPRNVPRALILGPLVVMVIYLVATFTYFYALPVGDVAASDRVASDAARAAVGPWGEKFIAAVALVSTFGTVNAYVLTSPRVFYALAKDGALMKGMAKLHPKYATPVFASVLTAEWAAFLALTGTYRQIVTAVVFSLWLFYIPTVYAYFRLRQDPNLERPFRTPLYPLVPLVFLGAALFIVTSVLITSPVQAGIALAFAALGVPAYFLQRRGRATKRRPSRKRL